VKPTLLVVALAALLALAARPLSAPATLETRTVYVPAVVERGETPVPQDVAEGATAVRRQWLRPDGADLASRMTHELDALAAEGWSLRSALPLTAGETVSAAKAGKTGWGVPSGVAFGHGTSATLGVLLVLERPRP